MSLGSKIKWGLTTVVILAAVATVGNVFLHDTRAFPSKDEDTYTFHAIFRPERREKELTATVDLNGVRFKSPTPFRTSPWAMVAHLPKGARVKFEVTQTQDGVLDCMIIRNRDGVVQSFPGMISGPGTCVSRAG